MEPELDALEEKLAQLVQRMDALREENRELRQAWPEGEEKTLQASADYLNRKLREVRDTGKVVGNERIAIMAALNIAHEHVSNPGKGSSSSVDNPTIRRRIVAM